MNIAEEMGKRAVRLLCHVNLIPVTPWRAKAFPKAPGKGLKPLKASWEKHKIRLTIRRELGSDISAACGQLRKNTLGMMGWWMSLNYAAISDRGMLREKNEDSGILFLLPTEARRPSLLPPAWVAMKQGM
jgi:hypothetical protein